MRDLKGKRIVVTGGAGFLGSFVVEKLQARGALNRMAAQIAMQCMCR